MAEHILDLEREGVSELNFRYAEFIVRDFNENPELTAFIREYQDAYVGSEDLLARLVGR